MYWYISGHYPSRKLIAFDWIVRLYLAPGRMEPGVTFTVEPAISEGSPQVRSHIQFLLHNFACYSESEFQIKVLKDGWTAVSRDDSRSTIIVKLARRYHPIKNDISNCKIVKSPFLAIHALDNAYTSLTDPYPHFGWSNFNLRCWAENYPQICPVWAHCAGDKVTKTFHFNFFL